MSDLDVHFPTAFGEWINWFHTFLNYDLCLNVFYAGPFAEANVDDSGAGAKEYVRVCIQQKNGRKSNHCKRSSAITRS